MQNSIESKDIGLDVVEKLLSNSDEVWVDCYRCREVGEGVLPVDKAEKLN